MLDGLTEIQHRPKMGQLKGMRDGFKLAAGEAALGGHRLCLDIPQLVTVDILHRVCRVDLEFAQSKALP